MKVSVKEGFVYFLLLMIKSSIRFHFTFSVRETFVEDEMVCYFHVFEEGEMEADFINTVSKLVEGL